MKVRDLPDDEPIQFVSDSQDVQAIQIHFLDFFSFDSFFVVVENGDYTMVWGMYGIVPDIDKDVHMLIP